ncbi:hypothetical protein VTK26DRAFT_9286 [Humicola hyalothermophila]
MRLTAFLTFLLPPFTTTTTFAYTPLSDSLLRSIPSPSESDFDPNAKSSSSDTTPPLLGPLLIPRVPGTPGQAAAQAHFVSFFERHLPQWEILWQNTTQTAPVPNSRIAAATRELPFQNIILRRLPPGVRTAAGAGENGNGNGNGTTTTTGAGGRLGNVGLLTLVAHYDSKVLEEDGFVGATDSAAPCAVLMWVAREVERWLVKVWADKDGEGAEEAREGVQIVLLDGEEAFVRWTDEDSLYGSRALAAEWEATPYPAPATFKNPMQQISLFVLLDLLGSPEPQVPSYFQSTHWAYQKMATIEGRLRGLGMLESKPRQPFLPDTSKMATQFNGRGFVGDDHVPFMERGAPVLHLIPSPFPEVWHSMEDDGDHLDIPTVRDWARIVTAFTMEWMDVQKTEKESQR